MQTIVIGHRNPDMDAICSAIANAEFKRKLGMPDVVAARAGNTNERIDFVLERFGFPAPDFVSDLIPKVADLIRNNFAMSQINRIEGRRAFGLDPAGYDQARPEYPSEVYHLLKERCGLRSGTRTFEIGPGTGLATKRLLRFGADPLLVVEPDERLADYLRTALGKDVSRVQIIGDLRDAKATKTLRDIFRD